MRIPSLAFVQSCSFFLLLMCLIFDLSHLISASVFSQCIPPLLQDLHFQLLYKLLLVLIQPYLLLLQLEKQQQKITPCQKIHLCGCTSRVYVKPGTV